MIKTLFAAGWTIVILLTVVALLTDHLGSAAFAGLALAVLLLVFGQYFTNKRGRKPRKRKQVPTPSRRKV